jgi:hypothetical protein
MLERAALPVGSNGYRALGLMANPFRGSAWIPNDESFVEVLSHAAAMQVVRAFDDSLASGNAEPVWVSGEDVVPDYYRRLAVSEVVYTTTDNDEVGLLVANVPFPLFTAGKVRSALQILGERLAGATFGRTLGMYTATALQEFDVSLPEASRLTPEQLDVLRTRFADDPEHAAEEIFGPCVQEREQNADVQSMMREVTMRQNLLPKDVDDVDAETETDELTDTPLEPPAPAPAAAEEFEELDEEAQLAEATREYVIAHLRAHLSPVFARGVKAYIESGADKLGQELKITKAPRKTIAALAKFASCRYRGVAVLYDDFEQWTGVPGDLKASIAASLTELRWALKPLGVLGFVSVVGAIPELEEQFGAARHVDWQMVDPWRAMTSGEPLTEQAVMTLMEQNALSSGLDPALVTRVLDDLKKAEGDLEQFLLLAGATIDAEAEARA